MLLTTLLGRPRQLRHGRRGGVECRALTRGQSGGAGGGGVRHERQGEQRQQTQGGATAPRPEATRGGGAEAAQREEERRASGAARRPARLPAQLGSTQARVPPAPISRRPRDPELTRAHARSSGHGLRPELGPEIRPEIRPEVGPEVGVRAGRGDGGRGEAARLQPYVAEAATLCDEGCNPVWRRLQPYVNPGPV